MPDWDRVGRALGGFAAGYGGTGPQYITALQRQQQLNAQQEERDRLLAQERDQGNAQKTGKTIRMAREAAANGQIPRAVTLINNLMTGIPGAANNPQLQAVKNELRGMQITGPLRPGEGPATSQNRAVQLLQQLEDPFVAGGVLPQQTAPEGYTLGANQARYVDGVEVARNDAESAPKIEEDRNGIKRWVGGVDNGKPVFPNVTDTISDLRGKEYNDVAEGIRKEIAGENGEFQKIANSWDRITASADDPSAAGDLALIFNFMKMLDPGSTVREGEFATAQNATGVPNRVRAWWNNLQRGERMTPEQRLDFFSQAQNIFTTSEARASQITDQFVGIGERLGINRADLAIDRGAAPDISGLMQSGGTAPKVNTQADFDALPSGAIYQSQDDDGQWIDRRKP